MSVEKKVALRAHKRAQRVRNKLKGSGLPRISIFRSLNHIYAQIIDDNQHKTIISCSSLELKDLKGDKKTVAQAVGRELAQRAKQYNITNAVLDRGSFLYHGRVQALAQGLREGGLHI